MQLSIIIVNYNVRYFLEQCLSAVYKAIQQIQAEVWVVDNASNDDSITYLQQRFAWVKFLVNEKNVGFARANNQALHKCSGEYVLFLNPDTIVEEDCFARCIHFLKTTPQAGALGIRMIDGQGVFLPESKRSFPSPLISLYKLVGLAALFPRSRTFARYSLGHLSEHHNHQVDVLAGAFLMGKTDLIRGLNGFDETFFMYGEDVDLSYRIQQAGFQNFYFAESTIIHFKGESTKKGSLNYVRMFYQAMSLFVQKHYGGGKASLFSICIQLAIWLRAAVAALKGLLLKTGLPIIDAVLIFSSFQLVNYAWVHQVRSGVPFQSGLVNIAYPVFTLLFVFAGFFAGMYDKKYKPTQAWYAAFTALVIMLAFYALLPERYRFSRGVMLFGGLLASLVIVLSRWLLLKWKVVNADGEARNLEQTLVAGTRLELKEVIKLLAVSGMEKRILGRLAVNNDKDDAIGTFDQLPVLIESIRLREIIFCEGSLSYKAIIKAVQTLPRHVHARFHGAGTFSIVGSDSRDAAGQYVTLDGFFKLDQPVHQRRKRLVDIISALLVLSTFPVHLLLVGTGIVSNALQVLLGRKTWVGYAQRHRNLPVLQPGVLAANGFLVNSTTPFNKESQLKIDEWYARHYSWLHDVKLIIKHYALLGRRT